MPVTSFLSRTQLENLNDSLSRALAPFEVQVPQLPADWADEHFYLSPESSGIQGPWETHPIQRPILNAFGNDDIREITLRKCARIGYTKMLMAITAYWTDHRPRSGVIYQPTDDDARDFMKSEIDPMIRDVPTVQSKIRGGGGGERQNKNSTLSEKRFLSSILHVLGGKSARAYRRLTKDFVIYDELDGFDRDIDGEGDPVTLGDRRITASPFKTSIRGSTPAEAIDSIIQRTLDLARMVFDWHMRCTHCGELSHFQWKDLTWEDRDSEVYGKCRQCGELWEWRDHRTLCEGGAYLVTDEGPYQGYQIGADGNIRDTEGKLIDPPSHIGFRLWAGIGPFMSWREIRDFFLDAKKDPLKLKVFVNTILGEPWEEEGDRVDAEHLFYRRENWERPIPPEVCFVTLGVDVQDDRFEWQISGWGADEEHFSLGYRRLYARTDQAESWDLLYEQLTRPISGDPHSFMPRVICIDSGHRADDVYKLCRKAPRVMIPVKGASDPKAAMVDFPRRRSKKLRVYLSIIGVGQIKTLLYARFLNTESPEGRYRWPRNDEHDLEYFQQLTAEERRTKYRRGFIVSEWWKPAHQSNEVLDCNVYSYAAMRIAVDYLGQDFQPPSPAPVGDERPEQARRRRQGGSSWLTSR